MKIKRGERVEEIIKLAFLGIVGALVALQIKGHRPEFALLVGLGIGIVILVYGMNRLSGVLNQFAVIRAYLGDSAAYLKILFRVIGMTYLCEFSAGICRDAGFGVIADQLVIVGKLAVLLNGIPILLAVFEQLQGMF
jgi:stage III sporulation protein AD